MFHDEGPYPGAGKVRTARAGNEHAAGGGNFKGVGGTFAHEVKHIRFDSWAKSRPDSLYEEYFAHVRDFLYQKGRRPTALERVRIWSGVRAGYLDFVTRGEMTVTIDDLLARPYGLNAGFEGWPGLW